jgi:hypothetical protein
MMWRVGGHLLLGKWCPGEISGHEDLFRVLGFSFFAFFLFLSHFEFPKPLDDIGGSRLGTERP